MVPYALKPRRVSTVRQLIDFFFTHTANKQLLCRLRPLSNATD